MLWGMETSVSLLQGIPTVATGGLGATRDPVVHAMLATSEEQYEKGARRSSQAFAMCLKTRGSTATRDQIT